jgi:hypothetical protein
VVLVGRGEDVGSLERLGEVSEDIIDIEERLGGIGWAGDIFESLVSKTAGSKAMCKYIYMVGYMVGGELTSLQAANSLVLSLGFIALGDNRRNAAASSAVTVLCHIVCVEASVW